MTNNIVRFPLSKSDEPPPKKKIEQGRMLCPVCEDLEGAFEVDVKKNHRGTIKITVITCCSCGEYYEVENGYLK